MHDIVRKEAIIVPEVVGDLRTMQINTSSESLRVYKLAIQPIKDWFLQDLGKSHVYLVPIRIFIAVGWLRACAEKLTDPTWLSGASMLKFFGGQIASHQIVFPAYQALVQSIFAPAAGPMSAVILMGQMLVGLALLFGMWTAPALLGGLFMNLNFLLAGRPEPSVFYLIIQTVLLVGRSDDVASIDSLMDSLVLELDESEPCATTRRLMGVGGVMASLAVAAYAFAHITHFDPAVSVKDPAAVLCVFACMCAGLSLIALLRQHFHLQPDVVRNSQRKQH